MKSVRWVIVFSALLMLSRTWAAETSPTKLGIIGLTHTHVHWAFESEKRGDFKIVGIVEKNKDLAKRYSEQHGYSKSKVYDSMEEMFAAVRPQKALQPSEPFLSI